MSTTNVTFCKSWFRAKKQAIEAWDVDRARQAHAAGTLYTVLIGSPQRPTHFIEVNLRSCGVGFLDENLREYMSYSFQEAGDGRVFLSMATHREFEGTSDQVISGTNYLFDPIGTTNIQKKILHPHCSIENASAQIDVSGNYEQFPIFGAYDALLKRERFPVQSV
ncbi:lytic transglycosylase [Caulobacter sp. UNC358MFTsu5.1]|uniref:lytic transglycosylase n=1 Tax=Caulobacter sp. UNC358MFTsu5.1 TaxID=1449049 RepID=UPI0012DF1897|nr:lytic transglycosylase [Caulobacter sp. UNC358MFTsu5.1]